MIILITGASHTGKTLLAQKFLEQYKVPYFAIALLKMGLIRSKNTDLTPEDDQALEDYLWPIVKEMIKTAIENKQNLVIEGGYIPFDWKAYFDHEYLKDIHYFCLVMSKKYIENHFADIKNYANAIEQRIDDSWCTLDSTLADNAYSMEMCKKHNCNYILIDEKYQVEPYL